MTINFLENMNLFFEPLVPFDTAPVFASDNERKVTMAMCSIYSGDKSCDQSFDPYAFSLLKKYQALAPEPILNSTLQFRFGENLYEVECGQYFCSAQKLPEEKNESLWWKAVQILGAILSGPVGCAKENKHSERAVEDNPASAKTLVPISLAVIDGNKELVESLIAQGADVNVIDENGRTPLMRSVENKDTKIAGLLISKGADVNVINWEGWSALTRAHEKGNKELVDLLMANGADVNAKDKFGSTALILASKRENGSLVKMLIANGADVNAKSKSGWTALIWAVNRGNKGIVELLMDKSADVNARDNTGWTALMWAADIGNSEMVSLLLNKGADVNVKDNSGWTALMSASIKGHKEVVGLLIAKGVDFNTRNNKGETALKLAINVGIAQREVVELLIASGAKRDDVKIVVREPEVTQVISAAPAPKEEAKQAEIENDPFDIETQNKDLTFAGDHRLKSGKYKRAIRDYDQAIELYQYNPMSYAGRGSAKAKLGNYKSAILDYDKAISLDENNSSIYLNRGLAKIGLGRAGEAIKDFEESLRLDPANTVARKNLEIAREQVEKAKAPLALRSDPANTAASPKMDAVEDRILRMKKRFAGVGAPITNVEEMVIKKNVIPRAEVPDNVGGQRRESRIGTLITDTDMKEPVEAELIDGATDLMVASREGYLENVRILIRKGIDVNIKDKHNFTALMVASQMGHADIVNLLIANGANINAEGPHGITALKLAATNGHFDIVKILKKYGSK